MHFMSWFEFKYNLPQTLLRAHTLQCSVWCSEGAYPGTGPPPEPQNGHHGLDPSRLWQMNTFINLIKSIEHKAT